MRKHIAILKGGSSSERVISEQTAENIADSLDAEKYIPFLIDVTHGEWWYEDADAGTRYPVNKTDFSVPLPSKKLSFDFAVIAIHGTAGEDGSLQGYFEMMRIPYSSSGILASSLSFDKIRCKQFVKGFGIPVAEEVVLRKGDTIAADAIAKQLGMPCFVKPNTAGSSFGVTKVFKAEELKEAVFKAYTEDSTVIIEEFMDGVEVSCGVFKTQEKSFILPVTEIDTRNEFFDYEAKYTPEVTDEITPARISDEETRLVQEYSGKVYDAIGCMGLVRVDFIIQNGIPYFLELNTIPGLSKNSIVPKQLRTIHMNETDVFTMLIEDLMQRFD